MKMFSRAGVLALVVAGFVISPVRSDAAGGKPAVSVLVPPQQAPGDIMRRVHGINFGPDGYLYGVSTMMETIYRIDPKSGRVQKIVGAPDGEGDDVDVGPDGSMAWTAIESGQLRFKRPGGPVEILDPNLPAANPVAFRKDGRLVAAQAISADALYEYDPAGKKPRRLIMEGKGDLNSFAFGPDGLLYSPQRGGKVVAINIDTGDIKVIAEGFLAPVKPEADGNIITRRARTGALVRLDPATGAVLDTLIPTTNGIDSIAIAKDGLIYASTPADSRIFIVDPKTGAVRDLVAGHFSSLGGLAIATMNGKEVLQAADSWGYRDIDLVTGEVTRPEPRGIGLGASSDLAVGESRVAFTNVRTGQIQIIDRASSKKLKQFTQIKQPYGVTFLDDGSIAVADFLGQRIARIDDNGITTLAAAGIEGPVGLARAKDGALLVSDANAGTIRRVDIATGKSTVLVKNLSIPEGLALMADGRVAVAETGAGRLTAVNLANGRRQTLAEKLPLKLYVSHTPIKIGLPAGVAVSKDGTIYVSCPGDFSIRKVKLADAR